MMTEEQARTFKIPLGKYKGLTLDRAVDQDGDDALLYLDWLVGREFVTGRLREALKVFLKSAENASRLDLILEDD